MLGLAQAIGQNLVFETDVYENMIIKAETNNKPFMIVFGFNECSVCKQMEEETYSDSSVAQYLGENFLTFYIDAYDLEFGLSTAQMFNISQFPSVLFFDKNGGKIGAMRGFYTADRFIAESQAIAENAKKSAKVLADMKIPEPMMKTPEYETKEIEEKAIAARKITVEVEAPQTEVVPSYTYRSEESTEEVANEMDVAVYESIDANMFIFSDVPGIAKHSVKDKKPVGFALKVGQFTSLEALKSQLKEYEKGWKAEIWVYSMSRATSKVYCIALGLYDDKEQAFYMRKLLYNTFFIQSSVVKLDDIRYEK